MGFELTSPDQMTYGAAVGDGGIYRYLLWREWSHKIAARVLWIMFNPSIADHVDDDPTVIRCIGFSKRLGFGRLGIANLYGFVSPRVNDLWKPDVEPVGLLNDSHIKIALQDDLYTTVIVAWGACGGNRGNKRKKEVLAMIRENGHTPMCFGTTKNGDPRHPLMLPYETPLVEYKEAA